MFFRNRFSLFGLASLFVLFTIGASSAQDISVKLDGRLLQFDQPPARVGGRMMVPLRGIFEALKADVVYDGATRSIQATKDSRVIQLQLGSRTAIIDGRTLFLDVPADTIGGRTMVPLRFVAEALGADVKWDGPTKTVLMTSGSGGTTAENPTVTPPPVSDSKDGPRIDRVFHSATTDLVAGNSIDIVVYGEPGGKATFEILGSTKQIGLPEVSSGKYQSRWTIPNGLIVEKGVLLAHLQKNGRETAVEAKRQVTVKAASGNSNPNPQASGWQSKPANGTTTAAVRPRLSLIFPNDIQANTVRFFVDGVDFSNQVRISGRQFNWQPTYNLSAANHTAEIQAVSNQGQRLTHSWSFRIDPNSANSNPANNFQVQEVRPSQGTTVSARPQIGALFNQNLRSINFYVDGRLISSQAGVQRLSNGILWTPNYNLSVGQHKATVKAVNQNGQVLNQNWNFVVGQNAISNFNVAPIKVSAGQQVKVSLNAPAGSTGSFTVGQVRNLALRETSSGRYEGVYTASTRDTGTAAVSASVRLPSGQVLTKTAASRVTFEAASQFTVSNLRNGMTISPVFNVQGKSVAGRTISVVLTYNSGNIIGAIAGQTRTLRTQGVVRGNGSYDVPVDASVIRSGQQFRLTVSDGQEQKQMVLTRR